MASPGVTSTPASVAPGRLSSPRFYHAVAAVVIFVFAIILYARTLAPTVTLVDSGELILASWGLGVAHPPGFPLYVMLAHLASLLPLGSVAHRVNCASAFFGACASAVIGLVVIEMARQVSQVSAMRFEAMSRKEKRKLQAQGPDLTSDPLIQRLLWLVPPLITGLLMACSHTLWFYSTLTEVYTLNTLMLAIIFLLMVRWRRMMTTAPPDSTRGFVLLYAAAFAFGLGMGDHHVTLGLTLPGIAVLVWSAAGWKYFKSRRFLYTALVSFAGLFLVYAYLPWAASRSPILNWGKPDTLKRVWWHITGRQYQVFLQFSAGEMGKLFGQFVSMAAREFGPVWLPLVFLLAIAGVAYLFRKDRPACFFLLGVIFANLAYTMSYDIAEDKDAYFLPVHVAVAIAAGFGAQWVIERAARFSRARLVAAVASACLFAVPAVALATNYSYNNRHNYWIAHDYVDNILHTIPPNGMLLTLDWQVYSPMLYTRNIEGERRDVTTIDLNLLRRVHYIDYMRAQYPEVVRRTQTSFDAYAADLADWDNDPKKYAESNSLTQQIDDHYYGAIMDFIRAQMAVAPVYVTSEIIEGDRKLAKALMQEYQFVPQGLVFELSSDHNFHPLGDLKLQLRGLADGTIKFEPDDVVLQKVLPAYLRMLTSRGYYLMGYQHYDEAEEAMKDALALNPQFAPAVKGMEKLRSARAGKN